MALARAESPLLRAKGASLRTRDIDVNSVHLFRTRLFYAHKFPQPRSRTPGLPSWSRQRASAGLTQLGAVQCIDTCRVHLINQLLTGRFTKVDEGRAHLVAPTLASTLDRYVPPWCRSQTHNGVGGCDGVRRRVGTLSFPGWGRRRCES